MTNILQFSPKEFLSEMKVKDEENKKIMRCVLNVGPYRFEKTLSCLTKWQDSNMNTQYGQK